MASLQHRSPLVVAVARKPELTREFRFDQPETADAYMAELKAQATLAGKSVQPKLSRLDTSWEVRIRQRGYKVATGCIEALRRQRVQRDVHSLNLPPMKVIAAAE